jgi:hypothetical protein
MACARSPSRGFAAHLVLHSPFPAAARPQGRILSIALQQVGDDKHTAGGGGRLVDVDQVSRDAFQGEARVRHDGAIYFCKNRPENGSDPRLMFTERASRVGAAITESTRTLHTQVRNHSRLSYVEGPSQQLAVARSRAHTARTRETPCRWRRGGMCTARSPSARTTADLPLSPFSIGLPLSS